MPSDRIQRRIDRLLDQVEEAADLENWDTALKLAEQVLDLDPDNSDAQAFLRVAERRVPEAAIVRPDDSSRRGIEIESPRVKPEEHPTSFANGRYTITKFLGEGGKKRVYLAQDTIWIFRGNSIIA